MIDVPFWFFIWMATVLIQAVFHFGLIGPRRYGYREEDDIEILTQEIVESPSQEEQDNGSSNDQNHNVTKLSRPQSEIAGQHFSKLTEKGDFEISRRSLREQDSSHDAERDGPRNRIEANESGRRSPINVLAYSDECNFDTRDLRSRQNNDSDPADENDYFYREYNTSCEDTDMSKDREDVQWKYELMKNYYSSAYSDEVESDTGENLHHSLETLNLRVVPTQVQDDIAYENGRIKWSIKRRKVGKNSLQVNVNHQDEEDDNDIDEATIQRFTNMTKTHASNRVTSMIRRFKNSPPVRKKSTRRVEFALSDHRQHLNSSRNLIRPLSQ